METRDKVNAYFLFLVLGTLTQGNPFKFVAIEYEKLLDALNTEKPGGQSTAPVSMDDLKEAIIYLVANNMISFTHGYYLNGPDKAKIRLKK